MAVDRLDDRVDALANVAGVPGTSPADQVLAVNFLGMRHLTERLLPRIQRGGSVVNVSSSEGRHWVAHLAELRPLLATTLVRGGAALVPGAPPGAVGLRHLEGGRARVHDGLVDVDLAGRRADERRRARTGAHAAAARRRALSDPRRLARQRSAAGRDAEADEIAAVVAFLMSNESRWINGQTLAADGGVAAATTWAALQTR